MTKTEARKLAQQIFDEFDKQIVEATRGTSIPPSFIAGLVANEAGKDRQGHVRRAATRFEPGVYSHLKKVAASPRAKYGSITHAQIADASDDSLRALATSYEATQMMGYWCIVLGCTLADLKNPDKHFFYTVKLLQMNGFPARPTEAKMDGEMRQWNTGRETGKTYHENYVPNAQLIREAYREIEKGRVSRTVVERTTEPEPVEINPQNPSAPPTPDSKVVEKEEVLPLWQKIWKKASAGLTAVGGTAALQGYKEQLDAIGLPGWILAYVLVGAVALFIGWLVYEVLKHFWEMISKRWLTTSLVKANATPANTVIVACAEDIAAFEAAGWTVIRRNNVCSVPEPAV
jgi:hypothetical protein